MKTIFLIFSLFTVCFLTHAQSNEEREIRKLEDAQRKAFLKKDTATLYKIFSPDFVVNAPTNKVTSLQKLKELI